MPSRSAGNGLKWTFIQFALTPPRSFLSYLIPNLLPCPQVGVPDLGRPPTHRLCCKKQRCSELISRNFFFSLLLDVSVPLSDDGHVPVHAVLDQQHPREEGHPPHARLPGRHLLKRWVSLCICLPAVTPWIPRENPENAKRFKGERRLECKRRRTPRKATSGRSQSPVCCRSLYGLIPYARAHTLVFFRNTLGT